MKSHTHFRLSAFFVLMIGAGLAGQATGQDMRLNPNYGSVNLKSGFLPDPYVKAVVAGGNLHVNLAGVKQYVSNAPDFKLHYTAGQYPLILHVQSAADTTLLVNLPDGTWASNDDGPNNGLNPWIRFARPQSGRYDIWVGTFGKDTANATLYITEREKAAPAPAPAPKQQPFTPAQQAVARVFEQARALESQNRFAESAAVYEGLLPAAVAAFGQDSIQMATIFNNLGYMYFKSRQYARALPLYQRSYDIRVSKLGGAHADVAQSVRNMTDLYVAMASDAGTVRPGDLIAKAPASLPTPLPKGGPQVELLNQFNQALQLQSQARYLEAAALYEKLMPAVKALYGAESPETANVMTNLGYMYFNVSQYVKAETMFLQSVRMREKKDQNDPELSRPLLGLSALYSGMGQYAKAEPPILRSLAILERKFGKEDVNITYALNSLGALYNEMGQSARAEAPLLRSQRIVETKLGKNDIQLAYPLGLLARAYLNQGQYARAEPLALESLRLREKSLGANHPEIAPLLFELGDLYRETRQYAKAQGFYQRTIQMSEKTWGKDHLFLSLTRHKLAMTLACQKQWQAAIALEQPAHQASVGSMATLLPVMSETEQLSWIQQTFERPFHESLSFAMAAPKEASVASAEWLLNGKASGFHGLAEQQLLVRDARDPAAKQLVDSLKQTRALLAALVNSAPPPGQEAQTLQKLQQLKSTEQQLAQDLARKVGRPYRANAWVTLGELRGKLRPGSVFVDIARFTLHDFRTDKKHGARYGAWITPSQSQGEIKVIDLGDAEPIDRLVEQARTALIDSAGAINKVGEKDAAKSLDGPMKALAAKVLHPLLPTIAKYDEWIICPDGALWLMPWNALPLPAGEFALEKHLIRHVISGRDLIQEYGKTKGNSAYVFADPNYDLSPSKVMDAAGGLRGGNESMLLGQRVRGAIGNWQVSFEFQPNQVVIRDEENNGEVAGTGVWKHQGNKLTIQTKLATFAGAFSGGEIRGERVLRNDNGTTTRDAFHVMLPANGLALRSGSSLGLLGKVRPLPGTALEAEAIRPKLEQWLGQAPKVFLEEKASETIVKALKSPRVLVLATHGYFQPRQEVQGKARSPLAIGKGGATLDATGHPLENPLLRCGLMLAGCNQRTQAKPGEDDGILTGLEIVGMNLQGCDLVVLSACETGLGDLRVGDGVAGLRQAFQLAGARSVLASLWQVPDRETAFLMNGFYTELAKGRSQAEALRQAQLQRIASRRQQFGAAHPFMWSAFALTSHGGD